MNTKLNAPAAPAAGNAISSPPSTRRIWSAALRRLAAAMLCCGWAATALPAAPAGPPRARAAPARSAGVLLLFSFLVPLPIPAALVAPPGATRAPAATRRIRPCTGPQQGPGCLASARPDR